LAVKFKFQKLSPGSQAISRKQAFIVLPGTGAYGHEPTLGIYSLTSAHGIKNEKESVTSVNDYQLSPTPLFFFIRFD
jgi:hypothetical protein